MTKQTKTTLWQPIDTAPKDGTCFLAAQFGETDREIPNGIDDPLNGFYYGPDTVVLRAEKRPIVVSFCKDGACFVDEFGNYFSERGVVSDREDDIGLEEMKRDEVLRLALWTPFPEMPNEP